MHAVFPGTMKPMRQVAVLLQEMLSAGVISNYAVFGAVAQIRYTEPVATGDTDVLITVPGPGGLDILRPIYAYCASKGYLAEGQWIRVGSWPVQFIPTYNHLTEEALQTAEVADFDGVPLRVVRADYLALIALDTGRDNDFMRVFYLLRSGLRAALRPFAYHEISVVITEFSW